MALWFVFREVMVRQAHHDTRRVLFIEVDRLVTGRSIPAVRLHGVQVDRVQFSAARKLNSGRVRGNGSFPAGVTGANECERRQRAEALWPCEILGGPNEAKQKLLRSRSEELPFRKNSATLLSVSSSSSSNTSCRSSRRLRSATLSANLNTACASWQPWSASVRLSFSARGRRCDNVVRTYERESRS